MDESVDGVLDAVEDVRRCPDEALEEADLPPGHDGEDLVQPSVADEVDWVVSVKEDNNMLSTVAYLV